MNVSVIATLHPVRLFLNYVTLCSWYDYLQEVCNAFTALSDTRPTVLFILVKQYHMLRRKHFLSDVL